MDHRNPVLLVLGFGFLALAGVVILFGGNLFGDQDDPTPAAAALDQVAPLSVGTPYATVASTGRGEPYQRGDIAPDFTLTTLAGEEISLADFRGRPVIVNFWATWCGPCIIEMPELQAAYEEYGGDDGLVILGLNRDEDSRTINDFLQTDLDVAITFPLLLDNGATVADRYKVVNMPTTFFVDGQGLITDVHFGPLTRSQIDGYLEDVVAAR